MRNKIAFIIPPMDMSDQYGGLSAAAPELPPLGIAFIARHLSNMGMDCDIYDFSVDKSGLKPFFEEKIRSYKIIGMPVFITTCPGVLKFAEEIKKADKTAKVVLGGPHVTLFPEDLFNDNVDFLITGEGEKPFHQLALRILDNRSDYADIGGLHYKDGTSFRFTFGGEPLADLDAIGLPLIEKFNLKKYQPPVHILGNKVRHTLTTRGCPYQCTFCAAAQIMGRKIRYRSVDSIMRELKNYADSGCDSVIFYDDSFTIDKTRVIELSKRMISEKIRVKWACFTRTDLLNRELLARMRDAGCYLITFGCESGNDKTLSLLKKGLSVEQNREGIRLTAEAGIMAASTFMMGLPGESYGDMLATIDFALGSGLTFAYFPVFEPYKGTPIYDLCSKTGRWIKDRRFRNKLLNFQEEIWVPDGLERGQIEHCAKSAFRKFYFRKKTLSGIFRKVILKQPPARQLAFITAGLDYFLFSGLKKRLKGGKVGTRY